MKPGTGQQSMRKSHPSSKRKRVVPRSDKRVRKTPLGNMLRLFWVVLFLGGIVGGVVWGFVHIVFSSHKEQVIPEPSSAVVETLAWPHDTEKPVYLLVLGVDQDNQDSLMGAYLVAVQPHEEGLDIIGIPGNSKIVSRDKKTASPLRALYAEGGLTLTRAVVEDMFRIQIPYYVVYTESSFTHTYDILGPVSLYVEEYLQRYDESGSDRTLAQGYQVLDASKAWSYLTFTDSQESGLEQIQRQERLLQEVIRKEADTGRLHRAWDVYRFWDEYTTNISMLDAMRLAMASVRIAPQQIHYYIVPGTPELAPEGRLTYWDWNPAEAQRILGHTIHQEASPREK